MVRATMGARLTASGRTAQHWPGGTDPAGGLFLTAGAGLQKDRVEVDFRPSGRGLESWLGDPVLIEGGPARPEAWDALTRSAWPELRACGGPEPGRALRAIDRELRDGRGLRLGALGRLRAGGTGRCGRGFNRAIRSRGRPVWTPLRAASGCAWARGVPVRHGASARLGGQGVIRNPADWLGTNGHRRKTGFRKPVCTRLQRRVTPPLPK